MNRFKQLFLNDRFIMSVILLNAVIVFLQVSEYDWMWMSILDILCTVIFLIEMIVKHKELGLKGYWSDGWNRMDGILVILSLPSLITPFVSLTAANMSFLLVLRLLRVFKFFRVMKFFPNFSSIAYGFKLALKRSWAVLAAFAVIILIVGLINCSLFKEVAPEYFGNPFDSLFRVFQMFTIEGWYEIPEAVAQGMESPIMAHVVRFYFCLILIGGGIIGMSWINSVFVDAMAEDNNDDMRYQLRSIEEKLDKLMKERKDEE